MTGLRSRQKADRKRRILKSSALLFRRSGYRHVRIEDIAVVAEVSVGTVYNYYATKGDILIAIVAMEVEEVLAMGNLLLANPPAGVETALLELIGHYYDHSLSYLNKEMWRTAMAISIEAPWTPQGGVYNDLDFQLRAQIQALLAAKQKAGEVDSRLETDVIGDLVFNSLNMMFMDFVKDEEMTRETLKARLASQLRFITQACSSSGN